MLHHELEDVVGHHLLAGQLLQVELVALDRVANVAVAPVAETPEREMNQFHIFFIDYKCISPLSCSAF